MPSAQIRGEPYQVVISSAHVSPGAGPGSDEWVMGTDERTDAEVYAAHAEELVRFATGLVGPDDAADVVTDAFVRLVTAPVWRDARDRRALWYRAVVHGDRSHHRAT
jgi:DNA-directed RNA polymerase specialized sigma24 family protein